MGLHVTSCIREITSTDVAKTKKENRTTTESTWDIAVVLRNDVFSRHLGFGSFRMPGCLAWRWIHGGYIASFDAMHYKRN